MSTPVPELRLSAPLRERLRAHADRCAPAECCGVLIGRRGARPEVVEVLEARNLAGRPRDAFVLDPVALLSAERRALDAGLEVLGCYHSHPRGEARPSRRDTAAASRGWSYLVVGRNELRSFRLDAAGALAEEGLT